MFHMVVDTFPIPRSGYLGLYGTLSLNNSDGRDLLPCQRNSPSGSGLNAYGCTSSFYVTEAICQQSCYHIVSQEQGSELSYKQITPELKQTFPKFKSLFWSTHVTQEAVAVSHTQNVVLCIRQDKISIFMCRNSEIYIYLSWDWKIDHITKSKFDIIHSWKKGCYTQEWGTYPYFICVWSQRAGCLAGCMGFLWIVCTICLMCILEYLW